MILTIWRHGQAEEGVNDRLREITVSGRDDVGFGSHRFHAACSTRNIPHPSQLLHSPLVRTTQTVQIIGAAFTHATAMAVNALQPGSAIAAVECAVAEVYDAAASEQHILLVSHQPLISHLVDHCLGAGNNVPFLTPGAWVTVLLEAHATSGGKLLFWALPPEYEVDQ